MGSPRSAVHPPLEPATRFQDPLEDPGRDASHHRPKHGRSELSSPRVVAFFDHAAVLGGGEIALWNLIERLDPNAWRPLVILGEHGPLVERLQGLGADVEILPISPSLTGIRQGAVRGWSLFRPGRAVSTIRYVMQLRNRLRQGHIALLHANSLRACILGGVAGRLAGVPVIITSDRGMDTEVHALHARIDTLLAPLSTRVIVNADAVGENVHRTRGVPREKIVTIYNGVDLECYSPDSSCKEARRRLGIAIDRFVQQGLTESEWEVPDEVLLRVLLDVRGQPPLLSLEDDFHAANMRPRPARRNHPRFFDPRPMVAAGCASVDPVRSPC